MSGLLPKEQNVDSGPMAKLDIVIVNWNAGEQLLECVRSVQEALRASAIRPASWTVVDNASSDGSIEGLKDAGTRPTVLTNTENRGFGRACNQGAKLGTGDYLLFLNPDVRLFADSLARPLLFMEEAGNRQVAMLGIQLVDANGGVQHTACRFPTPRSLFHQMLGLDLLRPARFPPYVMSDWDHAESREVDLVQGAFLLMRRSAFEKLNGFDERFFLYFEDVDLAYRAGELGWKSYYLAEARAFHLGGGVTDRIRARRLAYWLRSRSQYVAKHYGGRAARETLLATLGVELWARIGWNVMHGSWRHLAETIHAYAMLIRILPGLSKDPSDEARPASEIALM